MTEQDEHPNKKPKLSFSLKEKAVIVTGATSGIGFEIAKVFAKQGCNVVITGSRPLDEANKTFEEIKQQNPASKVYYCQADLSKPAEGADKIITFTREKLGKLDILSKETNSLSHSAGN